MALVLHPVGFRMRMVQIAMREIGTLETGANTGPRIRDYQAATWMTPGSWPYCAAFVCWCYRETCLDLALPGLIPTRPTSPRAFDLEKWGDVHARTFRVIPARLLPGDILTFRFSHVGIVSSSNPALGRAHVVEGNTEDERSGKQGVWPRWRSNDFRAIIRIHESTTPQTR